MLLTLEVFRYLLRTKRAARRCTASALLIFFGVPDGRGILQSRPDEGFVGPLLDTGVADLQVPSEESQRLVGFIADVVYMLVPVELSVDGDPEVLG